MISKKLFQYLFTALILFILPLQAGAISYDIQMGTQGGFGYSYIHAATTEMGSTGMYPSGNLLFELSGILNGSLAGNTLTINASTLTAEGLPAGPSGTHTLQISGGSLDNSTGFAGGTLDYTILDPSSAVYDSGTFYFEAADLTGPTNTFSSSDIYLWGQNWDLNVMTRDEFISGGGTPLGMDLGGVIPEPGSMILLGTGLAGLIGLRKKFK